MNTSSPQAPHTAVASAKAAALHKAVAEGRPKPEVAQSLGQYLKACETLLIQYLKGERPKSTGNAHIELGFVLYWLDTDFGGRAWGLPPTAISQEEYDKWWKEMDGGPGIVTWDGTLVGTGTWETFDKGWVLAGLDYLLVEWGVLGKAPFGRTPAIVQASAGATFALVGDWGTGAWPDGATQGPAVQVMQQIQKLSPAADHVIHLGDVYYVGTEGSLLTESWEMARFVKDWPFTKNSFALNSNHEQYDGANGYFKVALGAKAFAAQQGTSYFAVVGPSQPGTTTPSWAVIGLDTAYFDTSTLYMAGAIDAGQQAFLKQFQDVPFVVLLSHHNPVSEDGTTTSESPLSQQVSAPEALGRPPEMWYWGHVHSGIVYSSASAISPTLGRCSGHGAIPFGAGKALGALPTVSFLASEPVQDPDKEQAHRVRNGFATLTFTPDSVVEAFVDQYGNKPWTNTVPLGGRRLAT